MVQKYIKRHKNTNVHLNLKVCDVIFLSWAKHKTGNFLGLGCPQWYNIYVDIKNSKNLILNMFAAFYSKDKN
jgi:hypothetical protein